MYSIFIIGIPLFHVPPRAKKSLENSSSKLYCREEIGRLSISNPYIWKLALCIYVKRSAVSINSGNTNDATMNNFHSFLVLLPKLSHVYNKPIW